MLRVYKLASFPGGKLVLRVYKLASFPGGKSVLRVISWPISQALFKQETERWVGPVSKTMIYCIFKLCWGVLVHVWEEYTMEDRFNE